MADKLHKRDIDADFNKRIQFISVIDKMKSIYRQNLLIDASREETDAEHSWHLAVMAILLSDYAPEGTDIQKVIKMVLVHDLIEIYAGDTFCYDTEGIKDKRKREEESADRLFKILPEKDGKELRALWEEFDKEETKEALFAASLDRLQPLINNFFTNGHTWRKGSVKKELVLKREEILKKGLPKAIPLVNEILDDSEKKGYFSS